MKYVNPNKICGIYCIYNDEYFYVGQSNDIKKRWNSHKNKLKKQVHDNYIMQQVYDKRTTDDPFQYKIICECEEKDLNKLEIKVKNKLCEKYPNKICMNIANCGNRCTWTEEMKKKASKSHKGKKIPKEVRDKISESQRGQNRPSLWKKVVQLDLDGNLIKIWDNLRDAENFTKCSIMYSRKSCKGFQWQKYEDWIKNPKGKVSYITVTKSVYQFSKNKELIKKYNSIQEAADNLKIDRHGIHDVLCGKLKTSGGYLWSYSEECPNVDLSIDRSSRRKSVYQYSQNNELIKIWKSVNDVGEFFNVTSKAVQHWINKGKGKGFIWKRN